MKSLLTAFAILPAAIGAGMLMQYVAFDYLCWVLTVYFVVRLLTSGDPRWWLGIATKIQIGFVPAIPVSQIRLG